MLKAMEKVFVLLVSEGEMPFLSSVEGAFGYGRPGGTPTIAFSYANFSSTSGLSLVNTSSIISNQIYITTAANNLVGNVYRSTAIPYNRNFTFTWNFECSGGTSPPADGFCLQWTTTNTTNGGGGGGVGYLTTAVQAFLFKTYTNNSFTWLANNVQQFTQGSQNFYRDLFYWADYNYSTSTMSIYFATTNTKPALPNLHSLDLYLTAHPITLGLAQQRVEQMKIIF